MKKLMILSLLFFVTISCYDENDNVHEETIAIFKNNFENSYYQRGGGGFEIVIDLGRPSRGCRGFGVCELTIGITIISHRLNSNQVAALKVQSNNKEFAQLELDAPIIGSSDLIVENDVIDYNSNIYIPAGTYSLNSSIGSFGGYLLPLQQL